MPHSAAWLESPAAPCGSIVMDVRGCVMYMRAILPQAGGVGVNLLAFGRSGGSTKSPEAGDSTSHNFG